MPTTLVRVQMACLAALLLAHASAAQAQVWRCGNEFTNQPGPNPEARGCRVVLNSNSSAATPPVRPPASAASSTAGRSGAAPAGARSASERVAPSEQQARDRDARLILDAELKQAQQRVAELQAQHQQSQSAPQAAALGTHAAQPPARSGELQQRLERALSDVAAIERELARLPAAR